MASLRELQHSFAAALRDPAAACAVQPVANLAVYRNNVEYQFNHALALSFPVLRQRVGHDYFRQLAHHYRRRFPSRSGDLQWVGRNFPKFLDDHLRDSEFAWLADLARLEWARELAAISEWRTPVGAEQLSRFAAEDLEGLVFALQPSLNLVSSAYPVFSVWLNNQAGSASPVDQSLGSEQGLILCRHESVEVRPIPLPLFFYLRALSEGQTLGNAMSAGGLDEAGLLSGMHFAFTEGLVCGLHPDRYSPK